MADAMSEGRKHPEPSSEPAADAAQGLIATKKEFIQTFFKRAEEFTETLLRENERLRYQILDLEEKLRNKGTPSLEAASGPLRELVSRIEALEQEREQMLARF